MLLKNTGDTVRQPNDILSAEKVCNIQLPNVWGWSRELKRTLQIVLVSVGVPGSCWLPQWEEQGS
jgi:hypothetical protein